MHEYSGCTVHLYATLTSICGVPFGVGGREIITHTQWASPSLTEDKDCGHIFDVMWTLSFKKNPWHFRFRSSSGLVKVFKTKTMWSLTHTKQRKQVLVQAVLGGIHIIIYCTVFSLKLIIPASPPIRNLIDVTPSITVWATDPTQLLVEVDLSAWESKSSCHTVFSFRTLCF